MHLEYLQGKCIIYFKVYTINCSQAYADQIVLVNSCNELYDWFTLSYAAKKLSYDFSILSCIRKIHLKSEKEVYMRLRNMFSFLEISV